MWSIFSKDEISELIGNTSKIMWDQENGMVIHLTLNNNQCMDFVHHYIMTRETEELDLMESTSFIEGFLFDLVLHIERHLEQETPGWQERYYAMDPTEEEPD